MHDSNLGTFFSQGTPVWPWLAIKVGKGLYKLALPRSYLYLATFWFKITDVSCAKKRLGHACICPTTMVTGQSVLTFYPLPQKSWLFSCQNYAVSLGKTVVSASRIQSAPHARRRGEPMSECRYRVDVWKTCPKDETAKHGKPVTQKHIYTRNMLSKGRIIDAV